MSRKPLYALLLVVLGCGSGSPDDPVSTAFLSDWESLGGGAVLERGELVSFSLTAPGAVLDATTRLESNAFEQLHVLAVVSAEQVRAFGHVGLGAAEDDFDVVAISGGDIFAARDSVRVVPTEVVELGAVSTSPLVADGVFEVDRDFDVFAFAGDELDEGSARVRIVGESPVQPRLALHFAEGSPLATVESGCLDLPIPAGSRMLARVDDANLSGSNAHAYQVTVEWVANSGCTTTESNIDNDTVAAPGVRGGGPGHTLCGTIDPPGDVDVWDVPLPEGAELDVDVDALRLGSPLDSLLRVISTLGTFEITRAQETISAGQVCSADPQLSLVVPGPGPQVLHLEIRAVGGVSGSGFHTYRIHLR